MSRTTQTSEIIKWLEGGNTLTQKQATEKFGSTRLSAIIFQLRKRGMNIKTIEKEGTNRYGGTCRYGVYVLVKED